MAEKGIFRVWPQRLMSMYEGASLREENPAELNAHGIDSKPTVPTTQASKIPVSGLPPSFQSPGNAVIAGRARVNQVLAILDPFCRAGPTQGANTAPKVPQVSETVQIQPSELTLSQGCPAASSPDNPLMPPSAPSPSRL